MNPNLSEIGRAVWVHTNLGRKDATFGVKYPKMLVSMIIRHYEEMFVEPPVYRRYVAL